MGSPRLALLLLVYVKTLMCFQIHSLFTSSGLNLEAFLREFTYLQILRLEWKESKGQEHFKFRSLRILKAVSPLSEKEKKKEREGLDSLISY